MTDQDVPSSPATADPPARGDSTLAGLVILIGLLAGVAGIVCVFVASARLVAILLVGAVGLLLVGYLLAEIRGAVSVLTVVGSATLVAAGAEAVIFESARLVGVLAIAGGLAVFIVAANLYAHRARHRARPPGPARERGRALGLSLLVLIAVAVPLAGLGMVSSWVNGAGAFVRQYGTTTTVTLPETCTYSSSFTRLSGFTSSVTCGGARWQVGGVSVTGRLRGTAEELARMDLRRGFGFNAHVDSAPAYVYGDEAVTPGAASEVGPVVWLGHLSGWLMLGAPAALVALIVLRRVPWWRERKAARP